MLTDLYHKYAPELRLWLGQVSSCEDCEDLIADALAIAWTTRACPPEPVRRRTTIRKNVNEMLIICLRSAVEEDGRFRFASQKATAAEGRYRWRGKTGTEASADVVRRWAEAAAARA